MNRQKAIDPLVHCDLGTKRSFGSCLSVEHAYQHHLLVSFAGRPGYLTGPPDKQQCCQFVALQDKDALCVPSESICLVLHESDIFVEEAQQFLCA